MSNFRHSGRIIVLLLLVQASAVASPLKGVAVDSQGAALAFAHVVIHWDPSGAQTGIEGDVGLKQDILLETDKNGAFTEDLPPGFYDVFVAAAGFSPDCHKVRIKAGESILYRATMKLDPMILDEFGETFGDKAKENSGGGGR